MLAYGGSPDSSYFTVELDWLPLNKHAGDHGPYSTFNPRLALQYTAYNKLHGVSHHASDNNALYLEGWLMFCPDARRSATPTIIESRSWWGLASVRSGGRRSSRRPCRPCPACIARRS